MSCIFQSTKSILDSELLTTVLFILPSRCVSRQVHLLSSLACGRSLASTLGPLVPHARNGELPRDCRLLLVRPLVPCFVRAGRGERHAMLDDLP